MVRIVSSSAVVFLLLASCADDGGYSYTHCDDGPNPDGAGCLVPCADGWHDGADGGCHADCPGFLEQGSDGACIEGACSEDWIDVSHGLDYYYRGNQSMTVDFCIKGCPEGMGSSYLEDSVVSFRCTIPCADGWHEDPVNQYRCLLDCPSGMVAADNAAGCALEEVGERAVCPTGPWDDSLTGPQPVYVDASSTAPIPDGTPAAPFATLGQALSSTSGTVTIYVAAGTYAEQVIVEDRSEVSIYGLCADEVMIDAATAGPLFGLEWSGAVSARDVGVLRLGGLTIRSALAGVLVLDEGVDTDVSISAVRIEDCPFGGVRTLGVGGAITLADSSITGAHDVAVGVDALAEDKDLPPGSSLLVSGCLLSGVTPCSGLDLCADPPAAVAILARGVDQAQLLGNEITGAEHAVGVYIDDVPSAEISGNLLSDLEGRAAVLVESRGEGSAVVADNRIADCRASFFGSSDGTYNNGIEISAGDLPFTAEISRNSLREVQGYGVSNGSTEALGVVDAAISENELVHVPVGLSGMGGDVAIRDNRIYDGTVAIFAFPPDLRSVLVAGNDIQDADNRTDYGLPAGPLEEYVSQAASTVYLGGNEGSDITFSGNVVHGTRRSGVPASQSPVVVSVMGIDEMMQSATISGNAFGDNYGSNIFANLMKDVHITGNRIVGRSETTDLDLTNPEASSGVYMVGVTQMDLGDVEVADNYFQYFDEGFGLAIASQNPDGKLSVSDNVFYRSGLVYLDGRGGNDRIEMLGNFFDWTMLNIKELSTVRLEGNRLVGVRTGIEELAEGSVVWVEGNLFQLSRLALRRIAGTTTVWNNEMYASQGYGVLLASSTGSATIRHNIVRGAVNVVYEGVGGVMDGIQIAGLPEGDPSYAAVESNRISGIDRVGLLASGSSVTASGNMFTDNHPDCGGDCDFVVQYEPWDDAVSGPDTQWAAYPKDPYGALGGDGQY